MYQSLITILAMARLSKEIPDIDLKSIETPFIGNRKRFEIFLKDFRTFIKRSPNFREEDWKPVLLEICPRMRMTQGPNREVTLSSSVKEAKALLQDKTLGKSFKLFATHTGNNEFYNYVESLSKIEEIDISDIRLGSLALVPDSLNKHRLVAMVDYWTNCLLAPLEELVRSKLKEHFHHTDFLRNHSEGSTKVRNFKGPSWSLDLSNWTDRFPLDIQEIVVEALMGKNLGQHWATLLSKRSY